MRICSYQLLMYVVPVFSHVSFLVRAWEHVVDKECVLMSCSVIPCVGFGAYGSNTEHAR